MVKKFFALASITTLTGLVAATSLAGCTTEEVVEQPAEGDAGPKKDKDAGPVDPPDPDDPTSCYDESAAAVLAKHITGEFPGGRCTQDEADAVIKGCFGDTGTQAGCEAAADAHAECSECIQGPTEQKASFELPAFVGLGGGNGLISVYACIALKMDKPECALPLTSVLMCLNTACEDCDTDEAADACEKEALEEGFCGQVQMPAGCEAVLQAPTSDPAVQACIGGDGIATLKATTKVLCVDERTPN